MAQQGASGSGPTVDPQEVLFLELASDARSVVAEAKARFNASMAKSDALDDFDVTNAARVVRDKAKMEETVTGDRARNLAVFWAAGGSTRVSMVRTSRRTQAEICGFLACLSQRLRDAVLRIVLTLVSHKRGAVSFSRFFRDKLAYRK